MFLEIKEGAVFLSDAHENSKREGFYLFLKSLQKGDIKTSQLFLMGDMFDLLVGEVDHTKRVYKKYIKLLNELSKDMEIYYFEGNHDYNLSSLFENIKIFPLSKQPVIFGYKDKKIALLHGDIYAGLSYKIYSTIIRNSFILKILNKIDLFLDNFISKKILKNQKNKNICTEIKNFEDFILKRVKFYKIESIDKICEGHYHQDRRFKFDDIEYINFPSFACKGDYYQVLGGEMKRCEGKR